MGEVGEGEEGLSCMGRLDPEGHNSGEWHAE